MIVESAPEVYEVNGREVLGINKVVPAEIFEQYRQGYRCLRCDHAPQEEPLPKHCIEPYCRYEMRKYQLQDLEFQDRGSQRYGPTPLDEIDDMYGDEREREHWHPKTGIWVPGAP
jgi:hypothetical protein